MKIHALISLLFISGSLMAAPLSFSSRIQQTSLIELYTSEGCSSCPPAERKLNELEKHPGLWTDFVPVAFHVDYWNYIGWKDRFSSSEFSSRQRQYSRHWKARTIYTPCFVVNGIPKRSIHPKPGNLTPGKLQATIENQKVQVRFTPETATKAIMKVWIAPLSGKETSRVASGENRGRTLEHCFVALDLIHVPLISEGSDLVAESEFPTDLNPKAIAIWITNSHSFEPVQVTGGWLK